MKPLHSFSFRKALMSPINNSLNVLLYAKFPGLCFLPQGTPVEHATLPVSIWIVVVTE